MSMTQALGVLGALNNYVRELDKHGDFTLQAYSNGREQGFHLKHYHEDHPDDWKAVSFSEDRRSDNIVVYWGTPNQFSMQGNIIDDDGYRNQAEYFTCEAYDDAARFILNFFGVDI
jgi:hypothetical protein